MSKNLLFEVKDEELVQPYLSKVKKMRVMRNEIEPVCALIRVEDSQITKMIINTGGRKGKSRFSVYGDKENGGMKVYNLAVEEMQEISKGKIPQMWVEKLIKVKMLEDKEMVETKKIEEVTVVGEVVENGGKVDMVETKEVTVVGEVKETEVVEDTAKAVICEKAEDDMKISSEDTGEVVIEMKEVEVNENTSILPENTENIEQIENTLSDDERNALLDQTHSITEKDKFAILCYCDGCRIEQQVVVREDSKIMDGCHFYVVDEKTNKRYIGARGCLKFSAEKICNADNYEVMSFLNNFDLKITEEALKVAFERAQKYILVSKEKMNDGEVDVEMAFEWFQNLVEERAKEEVRLGYKERHYKFDKEDGTAQVSMERFQKTLDEAGTNYKRIQFCKALRMLENSTGKEIIRANRQGGYGYNDSNNVSWFKFNIGSVA